MTFLQLNLDPSVTKAILACGYKTPTPIQQSSIPEILNGHDVVASAQTGTGKTAAFVLPALHRLSLTKSSHKPRVLILTPTRELASQITKAAAQYGKFVRFRMASLVGGMPYRQQLRDLSREVDMIVATPGRLLDHMENKKLDLSEIQMLVLDEADRMLDMGFVDDVRAIAKATPSDRQTLLFSATVDGKLTQVVKQLLKNPKRIDFSQEKISPTQIKQQIYMTDNAQHKNKILQHLIENENMFKTIIFSGTKIEADRLAGHLKNQGLAAAALHGDLKQNVRNRTVEDMRRGKIQYLVATDVAARGIDIKDMTHVINYDLPRFCEDYVHRIGRTGRAGNTGTAISFVSPSDARHLQRIEKYTEQRIEASTIVGLEPTIKRQQGNPESRNRRRSGKGGFGKSSGGQGENGRRSSGKRFGEKSEDARRFADKPEGRRSDKKFGDRDRFEGKRSSGAGNKFGDRDRFEGKRSSGADNKFGDRDRFEGKRSSGAGNKFGDRDRFEGKRSSGADNKFGDRDRFEGKRSSGAGNKFGDRDRFEGKRSSGAGNKFGERDRSEGKRASGAGKKFGNRDRSEGKRTSDAGKQFVPRKSSKHKPEKRFYD